MKYIGCLVLLACLGMSACTMKHSVEVQVNDKGTSWHWEQGTIVVDAPVRPAGQQHVIGLAAPKLESVRVAFVGLGDRKSVV